MSSFDHFIRLADRLAKVEAGSPEADRTLHAAIEGRGAVQPYSCQEAAARLLLPAGFEWLDPTYSGGQVYASCRRIGLVGGFAHPHHGSWGATLPLAMCGAAMRARAGR